jgi:hypothetical protein
MLAIFILDHFIGVTQRVAVVGGRVGDGRRSQLSGTFAFTRPGGE